MQRSFSSGSTATVGTDRSYSAEMVDKHSSDPDRIPLAQARADAAAERSRRAKN